MRQKLGHTKIEFTVHYTGQMTALIGLYALKAGLDQIWILSDLQIHFLTFKSENYAFLMQISRFDRLSNPISRRFFCYCLLTNNCPRFFAILPSSVISQKIMYTEFDFLVID